MASETNESLFARNSTKIAFGVLLVSLLAVIYTATGSSDDRPRHSSACTQARLDALEQGLRPPKCATNH